MTIDPATVLTPAGREQVPAAGHAQVAATEETTAERWERAQVFFRAKDYAEAARLRTDVVEQAPEQTGPRLLLARAYYHSAQLRRAEEQLRLVVDRDPVEQYAHLMLGRTLERQGRSEEAAPWLRMAAALSGDLPAPGGSPARN